MFFLLIIFVLLGSMLYAPGIQIKLPSAENLRLAGTDQPTVSVAVTTNAFYFDNQLITEGDLSNRLYAVRQKMLRDRFTLVVLADKDVTEEKLVRLYVLAQKTGIYTVSQAVLPRVFDSTSGPPAP